MTKPTIASLAKRIEELEREVQKLKDKNQRELEAYTRAVQIARGEVFR